MTLTEQDSQRQIINKRSGNPHLEMSEKCSIFKYLCACFKTLHHCSAPLPHRFFPTTAPLPLRLPFSPPTPPTTPTHRHRPRSPTNPRNDTSHTLLSAAHLFHAPAPHATAPPSCLNSALRRVVICRSATHTAHFPNHTYIYTTPTTTHFLTCHPLLQPLAEGLSPHFPRSDFRAVPLPQTSEFSDFMNTYLVIMTSKSNKTTLFSPVSNNNLSNSPFYVCKIIRIFNISPDFL